MSLSQELWLLVLAAAFALGGIVWVAILRNRVRQHTGSMRKVAQTLPFMSATHFGAGRRAQPLTGRQIRPPTD
jgi:hypothetical protein